MNRLQERLLIIVLILSLFASSNATVWDNVFSQTQASNPINLTSSFNLEIQLPEEYDVDANIDFSSQLKTLTLTISKDMLIQKIDIIKAQVDLQQLNLNVNQFLLGCEKFRLGIEEQVEEKVKDRVNSVGLSRKSLFLINLMFKYIGKYEMKKDGKGKNSQNKQPNLLDILKNKDFIDQIEETLGGKNEKKQQSTTNIKVYDMFEFSPDLYQNPAQLKQQLLKENQAAKDKLTNDDLTEDIDISQLNLDMIKFVILTNPQTGQIVKAYKNKSMEEQLQFKLASNQKKKVQCNKEAKKLTMQDLTNGAKYLYQNKDSWENVLTK